MPLFPVGDNAPTPAYPLADSFDGTELIEIANKGTTKLYTQLSATSRVVGSRADIPNIIITFDSFTTSDGAPWIAGTSAGPMAIQDMAGRWWQLDLSLGSMATWFGAVADNGVTDNHAAFLLADARGPFTVPVGDFGINSTTAITNEVTVLDGGHINVATGQTLTLSGGIRAGLIKIFTGVGIVSGLPTSQAEWFAGDLKNTTSDSLVLLQAWVDSVVNNGVCNMGVGYFYTTGVTAVTATKGQKVIGAGSRSSSIRFSSSTTNGISFSGSIQGASLSGIFFDIQSAAVIPTAGTVVSLGGSVVDLNDIGIGHAYNGIYCTGSNIFATGLRVSGCFNTGIWCDNVTDVYFEKFVVLAQQNWIGISGALGTFLNGETINYTPSGAVGVLLAQPSSAMFIITKRGTIIPQVGDTIAGVTSLATATVSTVTRPHANGGLRLTGNSESAFFFDADIIGGQYGLMTTAALSGIGHSPAYCKFTRVQFDSGDNAVYLEKLWSSRFNNCWFSNRPLEGCIVTSTCVDVSFDDCDWINNGRDGLYIQAGAAQITVNGGSAIGNSVANPSLYHGIRAASGASNFTITNLQGGNAEYGPQAYDVFVEAGASNNYVISNVSNGTGLIADYGTGTNKTIGQPHPIVFRSDIAGRRIYDSKFSTADGAPWIHGTSAGPMAIQDASGQWWQIDLSHGYAHASWFGAVGDGVTDDVAALNTATTAMANSGGGVVDLTGGRYLINSADLTVHQGVTLKGPYENFGEMGSGPAGLYSIVTSSIVINPAYTIRLLKFTAVKGLAIFRTGLVKPTDMRTAIDVVRAFAGTAITFGDGPTQVSAGKASDSYVGYCLIVGFQYAIVNYKNERPHIEYLSGDCTNGILFNSVTDMDHVSHIHFWPFAVAHVAGGVGVSYAVTGTSGGTAGVIRIALGTNVVTAGDTIIVQSVGGTVEANGRWTVSAIGAGYIELLGSTYVNAWTSGGVVYLDNSKRLGASFAFYNVVDWGQVDNSFSYGYDQGFIVDSSNDVVLLNCGVDGYSPAADPTTIGYSWQNAAVRGTMIGCKGASHGYAVVQNVGAADNTNASANLNMSGCHFWGNNQGHLHVVTGRVTSIGCHYDSIVGPLTSTAYNITVEGGSYGGIFIGNSSSRSNPITFTAGQALYMSTVRNNRWADAGATGNREVYDNSQRNMYFGAYGSASSLSFIGQNARGNAAAPTVSLTNDALFSWKAQSYDGSIFSDSASIRSISDGGAAAGATPGKLIFSTTAAGAAATTDRVVINASGTMFPATDNSISLGANGARWTAVWAVNGTIQTSDRRDKIEVIPSSLGLSFIQALRPVSYKWKIGGRSVIRQAYVDADGNEIPEGEPIPDDATPGRIITTDAPGLRTHWGLIAQEVRAACDAAGVDFGGWVLTNAADPDSQQALRYDQFVAPLIKAVQELSVRVEILEKKP